MDLIVKICGLSTEAALDAALDAGADMIGLVFFEKSPRYVAPARAADLAARARGRAEITALTVDLDDAKTAEILEFVDPDWLQLHGHESAAAVIHAKERFGRPVMKAIGISGSGDLASVARYSGVADRLLLDAKPPKGAVLPGGSGEPFNWDLLRGFDPETPFMLAGGLDAGNVEHAMRLTNACGVDVSSGVESRRGRKDPDMIRDFIAAARRAERRRSSASAVAEPVD